MKEDFFNFSKLLEFKPEEGLITFKGNRMLLFQADALCQLREELIRTLGEDIARGVLVRFGYRCGYNDVLSFKNMFQGGADADWMLAGPQIHTYEGLVYATHEVLEFDRKKGNFLMKGLWHNSFEVQHHLSLFGQAGEGVCWILTGYASGYGSGFMGQEVVCVETKCQAKGDPYCAFEMRNVENWQGLAAKEREDIKPDFTVKSFQRMLAEERKRVVQWRNLNEAAVILNSQLDTENLPQKFINCAKKLVVAEEALLALGADDGAGLILFKDLVSHQKLIKERVVKPKGALQLIFQRGTAINRAQGQFEPEELYGFSSIKKSLLGIPLYANGRVVGALLMANKKDEQAFTDDDQELLTILGAQMGIALDNSKLYEHVDEKLQLKADELERVNGIITAQHKNLLKSMEIHKQLTEMVLTDQGIEAICNILADIIGNPVQVEDHSLRVITTSFKKEKQMVLSVADLLQRSAYAEKARILREEKRPIEVDLGKDIKQYQVPIVAGKKILGYITTLSVNKKLKRLDQVAIEHGATVIALEMLKQQAALENTMRLKENLVEELLNSDFESEELLHHRAMQLGFNLKKAYRVMLLEVELEQEERSKLELYQGIREVIKDFAPASVVIIKKHQILTLIPEEGQQKKYRESKTLLEVLKNELTNSIINGSWWVAVGTKCCQLADFSQSYDKALTTLEVMKALRQNNQIGDYDNLGVFAFLEINQQRFIEFSERVLGPLMKYEEKNRSQLVDTLNLYYKNNGNILKAARSGYLNPSTMKYRLRRIQEITGLDLKDPEVSLQVQLALKLINQNGDQSENDAR